MFLTAEHQIGKHSTYKSNNNSIKKTLLNHSQLSLNLLLCQEATNKTNIFYLFPSRLCFLSRERAIKAFNHKQTKWLEWCIIGWSTKGRS